MPTPKRILITGSNGAIGKAATIALRQHQHFVRGVDLQPSLLADESLVGSITDAAFLRDATKNIDVIIHLAATVDDADFMTQLLPNNIIGPFNILEAARLNNVPRIALASSVQVIWGLKDRTQRVIRIEDGASPLNHYAATKIYAETLGQLYANVHKIEVLCPRIGWLPRVPADVHRMIRNNGQSQFLSHSDAGHFFTCFVEAAGIAGPTPGYAVVFCTSRPPPKPIPESLLGFDLQSAKIAINYVPSDTFPEGLPFTF